MRMAVLAEDDTAIIRFGFADEWVSERECPALSEPESRSLFERVIEL